MDPFSLDMVIVVVVVAKAFLAEVRVFEGVLVGRVTATAGDEVVELVCGVGVGAEEVGQELSGGSGVGRHCSGGQLEWYLCPARALFCGIFLAAQGRVCSPQAPMCCLLRDIRAT
jgi:hypothetical protein